MPGPAGTRVVNGSVANNVLEPSAFVGGSKCNLDQEALRRVRDQAAVGDLMPGPVALPLARPSSVQPIVERSLQALPRGDSASRAGEKPSALRCKVVDPHGLSGAPERDVPPKHERQRAYEWPLPSYEWPIPSE